MTGPLPDPMGVLPLGDPRLRLVSGAVPDLAALPVQRAADRLKAVLEEFRKRYGFGRAIAAPQLGIALRMVALHVPGMPTVICNPEITWRSPETLTLWDDCMCFPDLLVRVRRQASITVKWTGGSSEHAGWELSELLQHEIDHLDGILAVDRAEGTNPLVRRAAFDADPAHFNSQVDRPRPLALS